jgi:endonuclease/exonuclease/phosphatase family metal-dependent hydrolase
MNKTKSLSSSASSSASSVSPVVKEFRIATYNVHKCRGMDRRTRPERIVAVIRDIDADAVAVQEIIAAQVDEIARALPGYTAHFGEVRKHRGEPYGNAVFSRLPVAEVRTYDITHRGRERRGCLRVDLDASGTIVHLFNVHLGTSFFERPHQARLLLSEDVLHGKELGGPRIVVGDFNEWTRGVATKLMSGHFQSVDRRAFRLRRTYPGLLPLLHLDHFYYDKHLRLENFTLMRTRLALVASDHLPLVGDFRLTA